jgi:hypothetical protein
MNSLFMASGVRSFKVQNTKAILKNTTPQQEGWCEHEELKTSYFELLLYFKRLQP